MDVTVYLYKGEKKIHVPIVENLTAEDVCTSVTKFLKFRPVTLHLFGIRHEKSEIWLPACFKFDASHSYNVEFRLRFKLPVLTDLSRLDEKAFDYTFHQVRHDLLNGAIADISQGQTKNEALGLCVTDMLRAIQENELTLETLDKKFSQFIPKSIYKKHPFFLKKKIKDNVVTLLRPERRRDVKFLKEQYLSQVEELAPRYLAEEFHAMAFKENEYPATIRVDPYHAEQPGVSISYIGKQNWEHLCSIEDLCFISMRADCTVELSRKNGIPICFTFKTLEQIHSYISHLDGYYRLCEKWTFNLCKDLSTPSLMKLKINKCHGPIGEKFAHQKLSTHPNTSEGSYILRLSSTTFDEFYIDFILRNKNRPLSRLVRRTPEGKLHLDSHVLEFSTIAELLTHFSNNPESDFEIKECLPPSEYDRSPLLLCRRQDVTTVTRTDGGRLDKCDSCTTPRCIPARTLQIFQGKKYELEGKTCKVFKAIWKPNKFTTANVAVKHLKKENEEKLMKEFLEMADRCVLWQCESLVALRGMVLGNPQAMVLEWMPEGPLDVYLRENALFVKAEELIEAASHIAKALWFLEDHGIVHGNIRCHNVLVSEHNDNAFVVKLADPSIIEYSINDIHWIPPEIFEIPALAKTLGSADVWALGTTFWEIFSYGQKPPDDIPYATVKAKYVKGWRLPCPKDCQSEIYRIILECWSENADCRKQPQALVRDIHQILYQVIGSKRLHSYATVTAASSEGSQSQINGAFDVSSDCNWTTFGSETHTNSSSDGTVSTFVHDSSIRSKSSNHSQRTQFTWLFNGTNGSNSPDLISGFSTVYTNGSVGTIYSTGSAQGIYVFGKDQITLGRMIGQGCYGAVFMGEVFRSDGSSEAVAVKRMKEKDSIAEEEQSELQGEFQILQNLNHPNIVEVKGVVYDPGLLLIMEYLPMGSLLDYFRISYSKPSQQQLMKFAQDVCEGMEYLVSNNIVHRDLAARNILVANDDLVKISDFGLARFTDNDNFYTFRTDRKLPVKWYPPESLKDLKFSQHSDVWSYGVTLYEIFTYGQEPDLPGVNVNNGGEELNEMAELEEIVRLLNQGVRLPRPEHCPQNVYNRLMLPCWNLDPLLRPTFTSMCEQFAGANVNVLYL